MINFDTYDFSKGEYIDKTEKYIWKILFIGINGIILLGCVYTLIFILIPIIKFRIFQCSEKRKRRYSIVGERIGSKNISLMKETLNSEEL